MASLLDLLDLQPSGPDRFSAITPAEGPSRLFGGQVAAQALRAATLTVAPDRPPHSLHCYFIRPGRPGTSLELSVDRTRDGRSFTTRTVSAAQDGEPILTLSASFHSPEEGDDWQLLLPDAVPEPDRVVAPEWPMARFNAMSPFELRPVGGPGPEGIPVMHPLWVRARQRLPDDAVLHACVIAFISDMGVVSSARAPTSTARAFAGASLDHALWFHRPARADEWLLFEVEPVSNFGGRGLARGTMRTEGGTLVASISQEALLRSAGTVTMPGGPPPSR